MKIGTIGTGFIVDMFLSAVEQLDDVECTAVYSRREESAQPLAEKYGVPAIYTDLDQLFRDPEVDMIYVASPNSLHYAHSYQALEHGKHVICEKPFTSTASETNRLTALAEKNHLLLFEGITTIHLPNYQTIKDCIQELGSIKLVQCNYSQYSSKYDALLHGETPNVFNPEFSGGALADINIYNLHFVMNLFGAPETVHYAANKHENGIDTSGVLLMQYDHFTAECAGAKDTKSKNFVLVQGEHGYLHVENGANGCQRIHLHLGEKTVELNNQIMTNPLYYELLAFREIFKNQDVQQCYELLHYSQSVMDVYEKARQTAGIIFAADKQQESD
ncbi:Gfo/Idh/MocA family protein [Salibacterium qingdaonense]|uniref:Predicted dehydrogenase n=1 Tax=Salibacterium qingdaonense TaxID=266892 RepID=A0A1I4NIE3_9BACI|nr:Gfo/Idh/MocA family oxidoreductase [Salibacterium qingdaonense]SFM15087.1 Predicted dehydrogenase [Salibacterium qingdaonense]